MRYFLTCLLNRIATLLYIKSMTECTNYRPWDTETPSHKISHNEYYEKQGTIDKTKHKPSMPQPRIRHTRIMTPSSVLVKAHFFTDDFVASSQNHIEKSVTHLL